MALSKCIKLLEHVAEDANGNLVPLAAHYDPKFTPSAKLDAALQNAMNAPRTTTGVYDVVSKLGINTFAEVNSEPFNLGLKLVDLSGDARLAKPEYTTFAASNTKILGSGSIYKIGPILAAHQLRFDVLAQIAKSTSGDKPARLNWAFDQLRAAWKAQGLAAGQQPRLEKIIVVTSAVTMQPTDPAAFDFEPTFAVWMDAITHPKSAHRIWEMNVGAAYLIRRLQWTYIASVLLQTGITDTVDGGLWVSALGKKYIWACAADGGAMPVPVPSKSGLGQQATAVSAARYLTLVMQNALISQTASGDLKRVLTNGDRNYLRTRLTEANDASQLEVINQDLANNLGSLELFGKHGAWEGYAGEALGIQRDSSQGKLRYVVVVLTEQKKRAKINYENMLDFITRALIPALDGVILTNNTP